MSGEGRQGARILPVLIAGLAALAVMKAAGVLLVDGDTLSPIAVATAQDAAGEGEVAAAEGAAEGGGPLETRALRAAGETIDLAERALMPSESERALLESLRARRLELERREEALTMRENLLLAAEQRVDAKVAELKAMEERIQARLEDKEEADDQRLTGLVSMYENMKPKAAAAIFDRMQMDIVVGVARRMNPQALALVLARMDPAVAERVTLGLAELSEVSMNAAEELDAIAPQ